MKTPETATDNNVGSKTPEEIKADAATCLTRPQKSECNRFALYKECAGDCRYVIKELYDLVLYYESSLAQAEREKDAAVHDLAEGRNCADCKHYYESVFNEPCSSCIEDTETKKNWQWRGVCTENTKEE